MYSRLSLYGYCQVILLCVIPLWANAEVYRWQDANGDSHFSDRAHSNAEKLDIKVSYGFSTVKTVYDGDTLLLDDGRKVRFLGINTPEVQHRNQAADAGGQEAKEWLVNKLKDTRVRLETSAEQTDKYGRTLAHVFTEQNEHLNVQLVEAGLAAVSIFPPNLAYVDELMAAQHNAEQAKRGIWQRSEYAALLVEQLTEDSEHSGWTRVVGKVTELRTTKKMLILKFTDHFSARIEREWQTLFPDVNQYHGKTLEVRGWLNKTRG